MDRSQIRKAPPTGKKVANCWQWALRPHSRGDLVQKGHQVHVFEALHEVGGGAGLRHPEFRLPKKIIRQQVEYMRAMGVEFETDVVVGRTVTIDELMARRRLRRSFRCYRCRTATVS
jgi:glutamate synthase (NADPH/NADH) small chain